MTNGGSMSGVRLTEQQVVALRDVGFYTETHGSCYVCGQRRNSCHALVKKGLMVRAVGRLHRFCITDAGRAWLAANKQGGSREQAE
jgi:hypothetical protein